MPWKNGGGSTTEIAVHPAGAGLDAFDWRVSMAEVASDGPFSSFPGIDRTLAVLSGDGLLLEIEGRPPVTLTQADAPLPFPADVATRSRLLGSPVTDLNVMTRRGAFVHRLGWVTVAAKAVIPVAAPVLLVLAVDGPADLRTGRDVIRLGERDVLVTGAALTDEIVAHAPARLAVAEIRPA